MLNARPSQADLKPPRQTVSLLRNHSGETTRHACVLALVAFVATMLISLGCAAPSRKPSQQGLGPIELSTHSRAAEEQLVAPELPAAESDHAHLTQAVSPAEVLEMPLPSPEDEISLASYIEEPGDGEGTDVELLPFEELPLAEGDQLIESESIDLQAVIQSVHMSYPLLEAELLEAVSAEGKQLTAQGNFDTQFEARSANEALGFYENYRQSLGLRQPLYNGSEIFGGYRIGRGSFEPWYLERQTNAGGEFEAGVRVPLWRDRQIDARRAELWRANYNQQRVQPEIQAKLVMFVRDASLAYWYWVAAQRRYEVASAALALSQDRNTGLLRRVEEGDLDPPVLQDNLRSIALREAKLIDSRRKLEQAGLTLALFYRSADGRPLVPEITQPLEFPVPAFVDPDCMRADIQTALSQRPELAALDAAAREIQVDLAEARNAMLPTLDAHLVVSQDVGEPTSSSNDKSRCEIEAGLLLDMPLQRRAAHGKFQAARAELQQISARRRFLEDRIVTDVQSAYAGLTAAYERVGKAREARELAQEIAAIERRKFELGQSDLLDVFLREQFAIEAANDEVDALLDYFIARANYAAALAIDWPTQ